MTTTDRYSIQEYKQCAAIGCHNVGSHWLEVRYIKKFGWFCNQCGDSLLASGLLEVAVPIPEPIQKR